MRIIALIVCFALATPAMAAEPWEGRWNVEPDGSECSNYPIEFSRDVPSERYRQGDDWLSPRGNAGSILGGEQGGDTWICYINKITSVRNLDAWIFDTECGGEGTIWKARTMVMLTKRPDSMAVYSPSDSANYTHDENQPLAQLYRCPPSPPHPKP